MRLHGRHTPSTHSLTLRAGMEAMASPKLPPPMTQTLVPGGTGLRPACGSICRGEAASEVDRMKLAGGTVSIFSSNWIEFSGRFV